MEGQAAENERLGYLLGMDPGSIGRAFRRARREFGRHKNRISTILDPEAAIGVLTQGTHIPPLPLQPITLAVVGYPYLLYDDFVNAGLLNKLYKMGIRILTPEMVTDRQLSKKSRNLPKDLFWTFSNQVVRSAIYYIDEVVVDGIIHVTAFGCGPDSMVGKLIELEAKQKGIPYVLISLDEHTGEAGVLTRLEAFVDMLKYRRDKL